MSKNPELGIFIIRVLTGVLFFVPGVYKLFVPEDFLVFLEPVFPAPLVLPLFYMVALIEVISGLFLLIGYKIRYVALPLAAILLVALITTVLPDTTNKLYLINVLFHIFGIGVCASFLWLGNGRWALEK